VRLQPGVVIVKFTAANRAAFSKSAVALPQLTPVFARHGVNDVAQMYPQHGNAFTPQGREIGLDRMYRVSYTGSEDPRVVAAEIAALPGVEYADPERIFPVAFVPNDPRLAQQYALGLMKVQEAWDVTTGSRDVVIGIVDSGVHWQHEDLRANIWINPGEDVNQDGNYTLTDINGVDDDGNGYVDDIIGIDFAGPTSSMGGTYYDNEPAPTPMGNNHGTHVAGISAAVGNNGKGIAGVAYNCRILPVKCGTDDGGATIIRGYDGIVYAADMGARVINCSWGGGGSALQSEQDRILYAQSKGAVIVAATGNDGKEDVFTPASYNGVLSVASVGSADRVSAFSNYGTWVDVSAPGEGIVSSVSSVEFRLRGADGHVDGESAGRRSGRTRRLASSDPQCRAAGGGRARDIREHRHESLVAILPQGRLWPRERDAGADAERAVGAAGGLAPRRFHARQQQRHRRSRRDNSRDDDLQECARSDEERPRDPVDHEHERDDRESRIRPRRAGHGADDLE
jgi:serine protease